MRIGWDALWLRRALRTRVDPAGQFVAEKFHFGIKARDFKVLGLLHLVELLQQLLGHAAQAGDRGSACEGHSGGHAEVGGQGKGCGCGKRPVSMQGAPGSEPAKKEAGPGSFEGTEPDSRPDQERNAQKKWDIAGGKVHAGGAEANNADQAEAGEQ